MEPAVQSSTAYDTITAKDRLTKQWSENKIIQRQVFIANIYSKTTIYNRILTGVENI